MLLAGSLYMAAVHDGALPLTTLSRFELLNQRTTRNFKSNDSSRTEHVKYETFFYDPMGFRNSEPRGLGR
jgi:hypothetical protein